MALKPAFGQVSPINTNSPFAVADSHIKQVLNGISTIKMVKVVAVTGGGPSAPCYVDVQPLVNMIDGAGNPTPHGILTNLPVFRLQGGIGAIICDPSVNDIGLIACCDRDSSKVKATKKVANPGSRRTLDLADGIYLGGILN